VIAAIAAFSLSPITNLMADTPGSSAGQQATVQPTAVRADTPATGPGATPGTTETQNNPPASASSQSNPTESAPAASPFAANLTGDWWGQRQRLADAGVSIGATLDLEGFENFRGGLSTDHLVGASTFDLNLAFDTEKLLQFKDGEFYIDFEDHAFGNPSATLTGDLQIFDKQNDPPYLQVFEMWYQQKIGDVFRIKLGKIDANTEFDVIDNGAQFINSSSQLSPTIFVMPTTPDPMPAADFFFTPNSSWYASFGIAYSNRSDTFGELIDNPASVQPAKYGAFLIGETGLKWENAPEFHHAGNFKIGGWGHTGTFTRFDGTQQNGTFGGYAILDQTLWQPAGEPDAGRGLRSFLDLGVTQDDISLVNRHFGAGVTWTGLFDSRPGDVIGITPEYAHISRQAGLPHPYELAIETFYQWQLTPWAFVQPDLQYIVHPGGSHANALVATMRLQIAF
jgi:porin